MTLRVVGAGLGRTGTRSLKLALEHLLKGPCYHMDEVFSNSQKIALWRSAALGHMPQWTDVFRGFCATVDWPGASFWRELMAAFPSAIVLLSVRDSESWWQSASTTIFSRNPKATNSFLAMTHTLFSARFTTELRNREECIAAFEQHNDEVRRTAPASRLLEWQTSDGWGPLCAALQVPLPNIAFPCVNTTDEVLKDFARKYVAT